jgi:predicted nucleic acid-binding protein
VSLVIDASAVAAWAFGDGRSATSIDMLRRVAREGAVAPAILPLEIANLLVFGERRARLTRPERDAFLQRLEALPIEVEPCTFGSLQRVLSLADAHGLTAYDAAYLELASRRRLPLVSKDHPLISAAAKIGVEVVPA